MWANTVRANAEDSYSRTPVIHPWVLQQPGFYDGPVESRRSPCINNALKTSVIRHHFMPDLSFPTTHMKRVTDRWTKWKCCGPVQWTWSPLNLLRLIFCCFFPLQQPLAPLHNPFPPFLTGVSSCCSAATGTVCRCLSHTAVNRKQGYVNRLRLLNVFEIMIRTGWRELWQWTAVPSLCLIQRDWHLNCIILFSYTFFQWFEFPSPAKH